MDTVILPFDIKEIDSSLLLSLPVELYSNSEFKIALEIFTLEEKRKVFGLPNLEVTRDHESVRIQYSGSSSPVDSNLVLSYITTNYKLIINGEFSSDEQFNKLLEVLNFVFKIAMGSYFPVEYRNNHFGFQYRRFQSFRKISKFSEELFNRISSLIPVTLQQFSNNSKMDLLEALVEAAFTRFMKMRANGSFLVSILESLFVEDGSPNIKKKLVTRIAGKRGKDSNYKERIKNLYSSRCDFFHNGKGTFNEEDLIFLENEVFWAIEEYIKNPAGFSPQELERNYPLVEE